MALALSLTACGVPVDTGDGPVGSASPPPSTTTTHPATTISTSTPPPSTVDLDVIMPPGPDGEFPPDLIVACPAGPAFPVGALDAIRSLDGDDPDGFLDGIEPFLQNEEGQFWPQEGWLLLHEDGSRAILVATTDTGDLAFMYLEAQDGRWAWTGSSINGNSCDLQYTVAEGLNAVDWRLDPAVPHPGPEATTIAVLLTERECVGGQAIGDRLVGPQVVMGDTSLQVAFAATPPPGDAFDCQGNPETPYTVTLPQPLGAREVVEGLAIGLSLEDYLP